MDGEMIRYLLKQGANKSLKTNNRYTALAIARNMKRWQAVKQLSIRT